MNDLTSKEACDKSTKELGLALKEVYFLFLQHIKTDLLLTEEKKKELIKQVSNSMKLALTSNIFKR